MVFSDGAALGRAKESKGTHVVGCPIEGQRSHQLRTRPKEDMRTMRPERAGCILPFLIVEQICLYGH